MSRHRIVIAAVLASTFVGAAAAIAEDIPLRNWTVPSASSGKGRSTQADIGIGATLFVPVTPCRVADTRGNGFVGAYGPPALVGGGAARSFSITGSVCTGIPTGASAFSLNFTVVAPGGTPPGGYLTAFPTGAAQPVVSTLNFGSGSILANAAVVPAGTSGGISVFVNFTTELIIDINGYFIGANGTMNSNEYVGIVGNTAPAWVGLLFVQNNATTGSTAAIRGVSSNPTSNSYGTSGEQTATSGVTFGVRGTNASVTDGAAGVSGLATGATGKTYGVFGQKTGTATDSAGVFGTDGVGSGSGTRNYFSSGVRGEGKNGVLGITNTASGDGVIGRVDAPATVALRADGNFTATGTKAFVEPHPTDPTREIRFVALEGNEAGTYFRGTAKTVGKQAVIEVPEDFRIVTAEEGLTVQLTLVGGLTQIAVMSQDLHQIVVQSTRDVTFHYHVYGVRRAFQDWQVVADNHHFAPISPEQTMPGHLSEEAKARLITNGTYNPDGTVNMQTAERVGWARQWRDEEKSRQEAARRAQSQPNPGPGNSAP